jgi:hypothetical protein
MRTFSENEFDPTHKLAGSQGGAVQREMYHAALHQIPKESAAKGRWRVFVAEMPGGFWAQRAGAGPNSLAPQAAAWQVAQPARRAA